MSELRFLHLDVRPPKDELEANMLIRQNYSNHPGGVRHCRKCGWAMLPPAYPGDYWDCSAPDCGNSHAPTPALVKKMQNRKE